MNEILLFTDGSVNTQSNVGFGAYLVVSDPKLSLDSLREKIRIRRFKNTSSTKLELQTLLWALSCIHPGSKLTVYTDSQNIIGLLGKRQQLEQNDYFSKRNRRLNNYKLYQEFYRITEQLDCDFVKVAAIRSQIKKILLIVFLPL